MTPAPKSPQVAFFDGRVVPFADARVPIEDRGLQFGESVYEVVAVVGGEPFRLEDHVARMQAGARELGITGVPALPEWQSVIAELQRVERTRAAVLYAQLSGGAAPRSHLACPTSRPLFFAYMRPQAFPTPADVSHGIAAVTVPDTRWQRSDLKTTSLLPAVMARRGAAARGADEALFVGQDGFVNEGTTSALFAVRNRNVLTSPPSSRILASVSAVVVGEICRTLGIPFHQRPITLSDLNLADELFLASTSLLVMPLVQLDGRKIATGAPGPITLQLAYHFQRQFWAPLEKR